MKHTFLAFLTGARHRGGTTDLIFDGAHLQTNETIELNSLTVTVPREDGIKAFSTPTQWKITVESINE